MYTPLLVVPLSSTSCGGERWRRTGKNYYCGDAVVATTTAHGAVVAAAVKNYVVVGVFLLDNF